MSIKLESLAFFQDLPDKDRNFLYKEFEEVSLGHEEIVFSQGDPATWLYVLVEGEVRINFKPDDGESMTVSEVDRGGVFGWSAVLGHGTYTSSAICMRDSKALRVSGDALRKVSRERPDIGVILLEDLAAVIADRLKSTHSQVIELISHGLHGGNS
jgi:CRP-like cAMP-binding protein